MTTKAEREVVLQGNDPIANAVIAYLVARGWSNEGTLRNVASKRYSPHCAVVRVELDSEYQQYWVHGDYVSKGENVLSTCIATIKAASSPDEIDADMAAFLDETERRINQSFAVRFLGNKQQAA